MSVIYRVRPGNLKTVEEINKPYLWFSRPTAYNDSSDANISSFINENESIAEAFQRLFSEKVNIVKSSSLSGICCFTKAIPNSIGMRFFPGAARGIVIEYDKDRLEKHFIDTRGLGDCFKQVIYTDNPTIFKTSSGYDILWEKKANLKLYKSVRSITMDAKETDELFIRMFTRLGKKYRSQRELRIILTGRHIPSRAEDLMGYEIEIPKQTIRCIHVSKKCDLKIVQQIQALGFEVRTIEK